MEQETTLGARLRTIMEERGWSYEQLGDRLGMNPQTLNRYVPGFGGGPAVASGLRRPPLPRPLGGRGASGAHFGGHSGGDAHTGQPAD